MGQNRGYCLGIDRVGDQIALDWSDTEEHTFDVKGNVGSFAYTTGTGKFADITGTYVDRGNTFKPLTEGTYVADNTYRARYKLPAASN